MFLYRPQVRGGLGARHPFEPSHLWAMMSRLHGGMRVGYDWSAAAGAGSVLRRTLKRKAQIKVVLTTSELPRLGAKGEVVEVARGYARHFLFPRKFALYATEETVKLFEEDRAKIDYAARERAKQVELAKKRLGKVVVIMKRHLVQRDPPILHAPVSKENIVEKLWKQHKIQFDTEHLALPEPLKSLGEFKIPVAVAGTQIPLTVKIVPR